MRYRKLPSPLKLKVHDYYYQRYRGHLFDEEQILSELSHALKEVRTITSLSLSSSVYTQLCWLFSFTEYCELQLQRFGKGRPILC